MDPKKLADFMGITEKKEGSTTWPLATASVAGIGTNLAELMKMMNAAAPSVPQSPADEPETAAVVGSTVALSEVEGDDFRYIRATEIESVCAHKEGSIIKTKSGDFHRTKAEPRAVVRAMTLAERK